MRHKLLQGFLMAALLAASVPLLFAQRGAYRISPPGSFYVQRDHRPPPDHGSRRGRKGNRGGWQRFGDPGAGDSLHQRIRRNPNSGWHRFGSPEHRHDQQHRGGSHSRGPNHRGGHRGRR
ncbi:MAG TPA: hypothetical protein VF283_07080 [Bryobacteraceae bacterium]